MSKKNLQPANHNTRINCEVRTGSRRMLYCFRINNYFLDKSFFWLIRCFATCRKILNSTPISNSTNHPTNQPPSEEGNALKLQTESPRPN